jgi:superfamily II DNA/RNA helicase
MRNNNFRRGPRPQNTRTSTPRRSNNRNSGRNNGNKKYINPDLFVNHSIEEKVDEVYQPQFQFADMQLGETVQKNLTSLGFTSPSAIQDQTIPLIIDGKDVFGMANTGTGKTAAFLLPTIEKIAKQRKPSSVLIMAPTRELALQIDDEFRRFAAGMRLFSSVCVGGMSIDRQIHSLARRPQVIIGTPGRLSDLIKRGKLNLAQVETFVLDEVDRMLDMGFVRDIQFVAGKIVAEHQTLCFSATMTPEIKAILGNYMKKDYTTISVKTRETSNHIDQDVIKARDKNHKIELLVKLLESDEFEKVLIFGETKHGVQRLADKLVEVGIPTVAIHGNKTQSQRQRALGDFKDEKVKVMIATDVVARGLDIKDISHVINFDTPHTYEDYVHRIGRTGRANKTGKALTFVS